MRTDEVVLPTQLENEPAGWYARFLQYIAQSEPRTVFKVWREWKLGELVKNGMAQSEAEAEIIGKSYGAQWHHAFHKYQWRKRADDYMQHEYKQNLRGYLVDEAKRAQTLTDKALTMLSMPIVKPVVIEDGKTVLYPANAGYFATAAQLLDQATKMLRRSAGESEGKTTVAIEVQPLDSELVDLIKSGRVSSDELIRTVGNVDAQRYLLAVRAKT